jgi:hypothetical protein
MALAAGTCCLFSLLQSRVKHLRLTICRPRSKISRRRSCASPSPTVNRRFSNSYQNTSLRYVLTATISSEANASQDITDNFKFITGTLPHILTPQQCEELVEFSVTFLRNSEYVKNPGVKSGLVTILFYGCHASPGKPKGTLGDLLMGSEFANRHLLHALMKFYIEAESTGSHTQFFDKFNIRYPSPATPCAASKTFADHFCLPLTASRSSRSSRRYGPTRSTERIWRKRPE